MLRTTTGFIALCSILAGCGGAKTQADNEVLYRGRATSTEVDVTPLAESCHVGTIYFGYDSADLDGRSTGELERVANCVQQGRGLPVHLVGATDPRGTEEYNLALGERRAHTVRNYLINLGCNSRLVSFASVGEEFAQGESEATWALDRHVEPIVHESSRGLRRPDEGYSHALDRPRIERSARQ